MQEGRKTQRGKLRKEPRSKWQGVPKQVDDGKKQEAGKGIPRCGTMTTQTSGPRSRSWSEEMVWMLVEGCTGKNFSLSSPLRQRGVADADGGMRAGGRGEVCLATRDP